MVRCIKVISNNDNICLVGRFGDELVSVHVQSLCLPAQQHAHAADKWLHHQYEPRDRQPRQAGSTGG